MLQMNAAHAFLGAISDLRIAGNATALSDLFTDDAVFWVQGLGDPVKGKSLVEKALANLIDVYEFLDYKTIKIFIDGDEMAVRRSLKVRHRSSGAVAETETAEFLTMKDGKCSNFIQYADSALAIALTKG